MRRHLSLALAVIALVAVAVAIVAVAHRGPRSMNDRVDAVAGTLKCPTCEAESVAASNSPIARSMRSEIRSQLRQGRTPYQIRSWFEARYGRDVVLLPGTSGTALLLWVVPAAVLLLGAGLVADRHRRKAGRAPQAVPSGLSRGRLAVAGAACLAVGVAVPATVWLRSPHTTAPATAGTSAPAARQAAMTPESWASVATSLEGQRDYRGAARAYRHALRLQPGSDLLRTRLAFDLLRAGRPAAAERLVRAPSGREGSHRPLALLVLGLAQRARQDPSATDTLRTFLKVSPDNAAADQVRRLLEEDR